MYTHRLPDPSLPAPNLTTQFYFTYSQYFSTLLLKFENSFLIPMILNRYFFNFLPWN
uniref:Uncharacterized protein n=1 Tax=Solanum lycopersicum TaxID=4081 RepID=A0A3Q7FJ34_SOLLC